MFTELLEAFGLVKAALDVLKGTKDLMPDSPEKQAATVSLDAAERALRIAEAKAAEKLDYHLCRCTFPPQIALLMPDRSNAARNATAMSLTIINPTAGAPTDLPVR